MVRIFKDKSGEYLVQTTCLDTDSFISDLAEAFGNALAELEPGESGVGELAALGILTNAMPIAFKLAGYKADAVMEQRTLVCFGLKMISIRLPVAMIEDYKLIAKLRGMVYQPLMRDALAEWIDQAKTEVLKNLVLSGEAE